MSEPTPDQKPGRTKDDRKPKLAEQLRRNLQRRKVQSRARRAGDADGRPDGLGGTEGVAAENVGRPREE
jgi:hypothetical protein